VVEALGSSGPLSIFVKKLSDFVNLLSSSSALYFFFLFELQFYNFWLTSCSLWAKKKVLDKKFLVWKEKYSSASKTSTI
jgi:hypothetical protein